MLVRDNGRMICIIRTSVLRGRREADLPRRSDVRPEVSVGSVIAVGGLGIDLTPPAPTTRA